MSQHVYTRERHFYRSSLLFPPHVCIFSRCHLRVSYLDRIPFFLLTVCPHTRNPDCSTYYHIQSRTRACTHCSRAPYPFTGRLMFHKDDVRSLSLLHRRPRRKRPEIKQWRDLHNARAPLLLLRNIRRRVRFL